MSRLARDTLRWQLTLWSTAALGGLLAALGGASLLLLDRGLRDNIDVSLLSIARSAIVASDEAKRRGAFDHRLTELMGPRMAERFLRMLDPLGRPDPHFPPEPERELPFSRNAQRNAAAGRETFETIELPGQVEGPVRLLTFPVVERGQLANLVQVALPLEPVEKANRQFLWILLGLGPLALASAAAGSWWLTGRALAPVDKMVAAARHITAEDLSQRLEGAERDDELGRLAAVLNDMLGRLERSFSAARDFSADAAHELRTPLTILKGEIEVALRNAQTPDEYRRVLTSCEEEVSRLGSLVEDLLFLARTDAGAEERPPEQVDLTAVVEDVEPAAQALAERAGVTLRLQTLPQVRVRGSAPMLFRIVFNLLDNAIKHSGAGTSVTLTLLKRDDKAELTVHDDGPGIAESDQTRIFDRFFRADPARQRGGSGLGLALVRSIVEVHGGHISVDSQPGRGTSFRIELPLAAIPEPRARL